MKHLGQIQREFLKAASWSDEDNTDETVEKEAAGNPAEAAQKKDLAAEQKQQKAPAMPKAPAVPKAM
jgi:hypothetical protein